MENVEFKIILNKKLMVSEANNHDHWTVKAKRKKSINAHLLAVLSHAAANNQYSFILPCIVTLTRISPRLLNDDNLVYTLKYQRDCIADYLIPGLKPGRADDDNSKILWEYAQEKGAVREYAIKVRIEKII
jgi:hypothetical protein